METTIRKASSSDIDAIAAIYDNIHTEEEAGRVSIGWVRGIYPSRTTAEEALARNDLFIAEADGKAVGTAVINQIQVDIYKDAPWQYDVPDDEIMVLHTLVIDPFTKGKGYGSAFVEFYEKYALENGCAYLRMDTNVLNAAARKFYDHRGYKEIAVAPCRFNGIPDVDLVLLEKKLP